MRGLCTIFGLMVVIGGAISILPGKNNGSDLLWQPSPCNPSIQICL